MNRQLILLIISLAIAAFGGIFHDKLSLGKVAEKSPVVIAIFLAALFVRLARGLPNFPFEKMDRAKANIILMAISHLRRLYSQAFYVFTLSICVSILFSSVIDNFQNPAIKVIITSVFIFSMCWTLCTAYLIYQTDITLFKSQSETTISQLAELDQEKAEATRKKVLQSFDRS
jgi:hypothetical protein